jgi:hypothetical protein
MVPLSFAGETFSATASGALYWRAQDALLVADLHLEKASWFARFGQFLPPYDSHATLTALEDEVDHTGAARLYCLGDSFHDAFGCDRLPASASSPPRPRRRPRRRRSVRPAPKRRSPRMRRLPRRPRPSRRRSSRRRAMRNTQSGRQGSNHARQGMRMEATRSKKAGPFGPALSPKAPSAAQKPVALNTT